MMRKVYAIEVLKDSTRVLGKDGTVLTSYPTTKLKMNCNPSESRETGAGKYYWFYHDGGVDVEMVGDFLHVRKP